MADDTGPVEGRLVQPGLPRRPAHEGRRGAAARAARGGPRRPDLPGGRARDPARHGRGPRAAHDRARAGLPGHGGALGAAHARAGMELRGLQRHTVEPLPARLRVPASACPRGRTRCPPHTGRSSLDDVPVARRRLAFEELFLFQLALVMRRRTRREVGEAEPVAPPATWCARWLDVAAVRADRRPAARVSRRSTPTSPAAGRCSAC